MTFDEAIQKSIKVFFQGKLPQKTGELKDSGLFYTPEYFDQLEEELLEEPTDSKNLKDQEEEDAA